MEHQHFYEVSVIWQAGRKGVLSSPVLDEEIEVVTPPEFPGGIEKIWSPEHLLVAAVNSCLMTTFLSIAENSKLDYISFHSKAVGKLEKVDNKFMISEIVLSPVVTLSMSQNIEKAQKVLGKSEVNCLISNSVRSAIIFRPEVIVKEE